MTRFFLASFSLLAVWLDPTEPRQYERLVGGILGAYVLYSVLMLALTRRSEAPHCRRVLEHLIDLVTVLLCLSLSEGVSSPFFPFFVFALFAASLRWQRRGTVWTAAGILAAFIGMGIYGLLVHRVGFEINELIIRGAALLVIAILLGDVGAYEQEVRRDMRALATEPDVPFGQMDMLVRALLKWVASVMGVERTVIVWEEPDEPWLHVASWRGGEYEYVREPPDVFDPLVAETLADAGFLCHGPGAPVLRTTPEGFARWHGDPLHPALRARFAVTSVLSVTVAAEMAEGRLFFLDKRMTSDDLVMGGVISRRVASRLNRFYLMRRLAETAALEERLRVARDLHDRAFHARPESRSS